MRVAMIITNQSWRYMPFDNGNDDVVCCQSRGGDSQSCASNIVNNNQID